MNLRFWRFVHNRLEQAWHWVYYHKILPHEPLPPLTQYKYTYSYSVGKSVVIAFDPDDLTD